MRDFNRFNDVFMKYLLAQNERKHLTLSLINAVFVEADTDLSPERIKALAQSIASH